MSLRIFRAFPPMFFVLFLLVEHLEAAPAWRPTALTASPASSTQLNLSWVDNATDEIGFTIMRRPTTTSPWSSIVTTATNGTSYADSGLSGSTTYYYRVHASRVGSNSNYSNTASATTSAGADTTAPSVSTALTANAISCSQNNLGWAASTDTAGGSGLKGYNVYQNGAF